MSLCRIFFCVVGRGCLLCPVCSLGKTINLCPASFCTPRPNLPVNPGISWLPTFAFRSPIMKGHIFGVLLLEGLVGLHRTVQRSASSAFLDRAKTWVTVILNALPWKLTEIILSFLRLHPSTAFWTLLLTMMATPFFLRDSWLQLPGSSPHRIQGNPKEKRHQQRK